MFWRLPDKRREMVRVYTNALTSGNWKKHRRRYLLFLILRPALGWAKDKLVEAGLEPNEAESELFLLVCKVFSSYDINKSCVLYHLESNIPWRVEALVKGIEEKNQEIPSGLFVDDEAYEMDDEVYLTIPNILFEKRWLGKDLSQYEKNLILRILVDDRPSCRKTANNCQISKSTMSKDLRILAGKLKGRL